MTSEAERNCQQQYEAAQRTVAQFFQQVPSSCAKPVHDDYQGDQTALCSFGLPVAKQTQAELLQRNYLHKYLQYRSSDSEGCLEAFMATKLEPERFIQWAGALPRCPDDTTITQVTPTVRSIPSAGDAFDAALLNIFSATCKPLDRAAFLRGVRQRFRVMRYEARTQGPAGPFRQDMADTMALTTLDAGSSERKLGRCIFGSIVLVLVHDQTLHSRHAVFAVARGPFKHGSDAGTPAPSYLPTRVCVSWAVTVQFDRVEAWWQDMMSRQVLRVASAAGSISRVLGLQVSSLPPLVAGAKLIRVALQMDAYSLHSDVVKRAASRFEDADEAISDQDLLEDPLQSEASSASEVACLDN